MNKILKNYLRNFIKNWMESIGFLTFIVILFCILFGLIAAPVQILYNRSFISSRSQLPDSVAVSDSRLDIVNDDYFLQKLYYNNSDYRFDVDIKEGQYYFSYNIDESTSDENDIYMNMYIQSYVTTFNLESIKDKKQYSRVLRLLKDDYIEKTSTKHVPFLLNLYREGDKKDSDIYDLSDYSKSESIPDKIDKSKILHFNDKSQLQTFNNFRWNVAQFIKSNIENARILWDSSNLINYTDKYIESFNNKTIVKTYLNSKKIFSPELNKILFSEQKVGDKNSFNYWGDLSTWVSSNLINYYLKINKQKNVNFNFENRVFGKRSSNTNLNVLISSSDSIGYVSDNQKLDKFVLTKGRMPVFNRQSSSTEVLLSEGYAKLNNIKIGKSFNFIGLNLTAVGYGVKASYQFPYDFQILSQNISDYGFMFMPNDSISNLKKQIYNENIDDYYDLWNYNSRYSFSFKNESTPEDVYLNKNSANKNDSFFSKSFINQITEKFKDSYMFKPMQTQFLQALLYVALSVILLIMSLLFTNIIIRKELNQTRKQIGIFKSMGYRTIEISWIFSVKVFIVIFLGALIGYLVSFPLQIYTSKIWQIQTVFYIEPIYSKFLILLIVFLIVPVTVTLLSLYFNYLYLRENNLSLLNNSRKIKTRKFLYRKKIIKKYSITSSNKYFKFKLMKNFTIQSIGKYISVCLILFITSLSTLAGLEAISVMKQTVYKDLEQYNSNYKSKFYLNPSSSTNFKTINSENDKEPKIVPELTDASSYYDYKDKHSILSYLKNNKTMTINYGEKLKMLLNIISKKVNSEPSSLILKGKLDISNIENIKKWTPGVLLLSKLSTISKNTQYSDLVNSIDFTKKDPLDDTLITLQIGAGEENNPYKFFYLNDFTRLFSLLNIYSIINDVHNIEPKADINKIYKNNVDINESKYWGINDHYDNIYNPKREEPKLIKGLKLKNSSTDSRVKKLIKTLSSLDENYKSFLVNAILGRKDINNNQLVTFNSLFYNSDSDILDYEIELKGHQLHSSNNFKLLDFSSYYVNNNHKLNLGKYDNIFNIPGITPEQFEKLTQSNDDGSINVLVSNLTMKAENIGKTIYTKMLNGINLKLNVIGTVKSINSSNNIIGDYTAFMNKFNVKLSKINKKQNGIYSLPVNHLYTNYNVYEGRIDFTSIDNTLKNVTYSFPTINLTSENDKRIVTDVLLNVTKNYEWHDDLVNLLKSQDIDVSKSDNIINVQNNSNILNSNSTYGDSLITNNNTRFESKNLKLKGVYEISYRFIFMLYLLILLISFMICIMFITVVSIIIEESLYSILMLKAIGYKRNNINIMIMGNYIIASLFILLISWFINLGLWILISKMAWKTSDILIDPIPSISSFLIVFAQMLGILILGYVTCDIKNRRSSITRFIT